MAKKRRKKPGYFRANWKLLTLLLGPLGLLLGGIILLAVYESSYTFRMSYDKWWNDLWTSAPASSSAKRAPIVPVVATYKEEKVAACKAMPNYYIRADKDAPPPIDLGPAIGLESGVGRKEIHDRCVIFAKSVSKMMSVSNQRHHAYLCPGSRVKLGKGFGFMPDPKGDGVMIASGDLNAKEVKVPLLPGRQAFYKDWQFYNLGDGCYIVGYSTRRTRAMEVFNR